MTTDLAQQLEAKRQKRIADMTPGRAESSIRIGSEMLGDHDYLTAEIELRIVADWLKQHSQKLAMVRGALIGAFAGGHMDGPDGKGYSKSILLQIADILDVKIVEHTEIHK